ncbi:carboxypeptidase-like regulatory domain-containing protein [Flavobacterium ammonificans]|jgi:hypothetical protein|uniref:carboxypeptidase-like regulatory domain-containing protein n=1 Tax=Flavobacterium ammonificans TaxID=1751056 RepID=UPI001E2AAE5B|nr:carboxypeptidase-like regulatory domain-containing protein [Flavobacterium ammonificans]BDB56269.1 membrane protein [Flavobacterium ammonificans]
MKIVLFFFITFSLSAQIKGVVKDSISGQPIPYVNIWVENESVGTTSETDGSFSLDIKEEKVLVFSALGFEIKRASSKNEIIFLIPKVFELNEVVIERPKFQKEIEIGEKLQKKAIRISDKVGNLKARYFPFNESFSETRLIKKVKIVTQSQIPNAKFKIRVLSVNSKGFPDADLIEEEIIVTVKKGRNENVIKFEKYNLVFPDNGVFIVFETLFLDTNKSYTRFANQKSKTVTYEPGLSYNLVEEENSFVFTSKGWYRFPRQPRSQKGDFKIYDNKVFEPAINLTLTN